MASTEMELRDSQLRAVRLLQHAISQNSRNHEYVVMIPNTTNAEITVATMMGITTTILGTLFTEEQQVAILDAFADQIMKGNL
ncbi:hypothetical protein [Corynebacterium hindlerae]|uniref:hypothetical protein n=1 Tax=Corynebacterium hindlerae TaxID=699041 RepID=UPI003AABB429